MGIIFPEMPHTCYEVLIAQWTQSRLKYKICLIDRSNCLIST